MAAPSPNSTFYAPQPSGYPPPNTSGLEMQAACSTLGHPYFTQSLPERATLAAGGYTVLAAGSGTLITNIAALPSTAAMGMLYNNEPKFGKSYIVDTISFFTAVVDATQANSHILLGNLQTYANNVTNGAPADSGTVKIKTNCTPYTGNAIVKTNSTPFTITNNGWFNIGAASPSGQAAAGAIWIGQEVPVMGKIVLPPGTSLAFSEISLAAVTSSIAFTLVWHEVLLPVVS